MRNHDKPMKKLQLRRETVRTTVRSGLRAGIEHQHSAETDPTMGGGQSGMVTSPDQANQPQEGQGSVKSPSPLSHRPPHAV